jgi:cell division inhibitor SepF
MGVMNKLMDLLGLQEEEEILERQAISEYEDEEPVARKNQGRGNVVSIHSQKTGRVVLCEPRSYEEAQELADHLRSRRSIVVNLQRVRNDQAIRIVDFLSGTVYALNGHISKVGSNIFLCTPDNMDIQGTITEILTDESHK